MKNQTRPSFAASFRSRAENPENASDAGKQHAPERRSAPRASCRSGRTSSRARLGFRNRNRLELVRLEMIARQILEPMRLFQPEIDLTPAPAGKTDSDTTKDANNLIRFCERPSACPVRQ